MKFLAMICLVVLVLCSGKAVAEEETGKVLVIAADHSGSMLKGGSPSWRHIRIQQAAMMSVFSEPRYNCGDLTIVYFAWSQEVHEGVYTLELDDANRSGFIAGVESLATQSQERGTIHSIAYMQAQKIFATYPEHEHYLLVTTDEIGAGTDLTHLVPDAKVFAVTYTEQSAEYATEYLATERWNVLLATDAQSATTALTLVLNEIIAEVCTGV